MDREYRVITISRLPVTESPATLTSPSGERALTLANVSVDSSSWPLQI